MAADLAAQIEHHHLAGPLHVISLQKFEEKAGYEQANVEARNLCDAGERGWAEPARKERRSSAAWGEVPINRNFGEVRPEDISGGLQDDRAERERNLPFIRPKIAEQPLHQSAVVRFAEYLFLVDAGHEPSLEYRS